MTPAPSLSPPVMVVVEDLAVAAEVEQAAG
jgi:hypothetical protein